MRRIQVDQVRNAIRINSPETGQFISRQRMACGSHTIDLQCIKKLANILYERGCIVAGLWFFGQAVSPPRQAEHSKAVCEFWRKVIEDVTRVAQPMKKQDRCSLSSPIQVVELDAI